MLYASGSKTLAKSQINLEQLNDRSGARHGLPSGWDQSMEFFELVKSIGEARSKAEEVRIILREIKTLNRS